MHSLQVVPLRRTLRNIVLFKEKDKHYKFEKRTIIIKFIQFLKTLLIWYIKIQYDEHFEFYLNIAQNKCIADSPPPNRISFWNEKDLRQLIYSDHSGTSSRTFRNTAFWMIYNAHWISDDSRNYFECIIIRIG